jgi:hypothetical protein
VSVAAWRPPCYLPADSGTLDSNCHLSRLQTVPVLNTVQRRSCLRNPQIMLGVRVYSNVGLERFLHCRSWDFCCRGSHDCSCSYISFFSAGLIGSATCHWQISCQMTSATVGCENNGQGAAVIKYPYLQSSRKRKLVPRMVPSIGALNSLSTNQRYCIPNSIRLLWTATGFCGGVFPSRGSKRRRKEKIHSTCAPITT